MDNLIKLDNSPVYTIGIAAQLTKTSVHALRTYEKKGIIIPHITESNRRLYSAADIERIKCIRKHLDEDGLNIAGIKTLLATIPCWLIKPCSEESRKICDAYTNTLAPCWEAENKAPECVDADCRECPVYRMGDSCGDVKSLNKQFFIQTEKYGKVIK